MDFLSPVVSISFINLLFVHHALLQGLYFTDRLLLVSGCIKNMFSEPSVSEKFWFLIVLTV